MRDLRLARATPAARPRRSRARTRSATASASSGSRTRASSSCSARPATSPTARSCPALYQLWRTNLLPARVRPPRDRPPAVRRRDAPRRVPGVAREVLAGPAARRGGLADASRRGSATSACDFDDADGVRRARDDGSRRSTRSRTRARQPPLLPRDASRRRSPRSSPSWAGSGSTTSATTAAGAGSSSRSRSATTSTSAIRLNREVGKVFRESQVYRIDHYLGQGDRPEPAGLPVRQRDLRADLEPPPHRPRPDHRRRVDRRREPRRVLRGDRREPRLPPEPPAAADEPRRDGAAGDVRGGRRSATRRSRSCGRSRELAPTGSGPTSSAASTGRAGSRGKPVDGLPRGAGGRPGVRDRDLRRRPARGRRLALVAASRSTCGPASACRSGRRRSRSSSRRCRTGCSATRAAEPEPNLLAMRIQPDEGIMLRFAAKVPGLGIDVRSVNMDFTYGSAFTVDSPDAYETLILDALLGDASLFTRADEVEARLGDRHADHRDVGRSTTPPDVPELRGRHLGPGRGRRAAGPRWPEVAADLSDQRRRPHRSPSCSTPGEPGRARPRAGDRARRQHRGDRAGARPDLGPQTMQRDVDLDHDGVRRSPRRRPDERDEPRRDRPPAGGRRALRGDHPRPHRTPPVADDDRPRRPTPTARPGSTPRSTAHCVVPRADAPGDLRRDDLPDVRRRVRAGTSSAIVAPLLIHDLPVTLWWPDEPPFAEPASANELLEMCDRLVDRRLELARHAASPRSGGWPTFQRAPARSRSRTSRWSASRAGGRRSRRSSTSRTSCRTSATSAAITVTYGGPRRGGAETTNIVKPVYHVGVARVAARDARREAARRVTVADGDRPRSALANPAAASARRSAWTARRRRRRSGPCCRRCRRARRSGSSSGRTPRLRAARRRHRRAGGRPRPGLARRRPCLERGFNAPRRNEHRPPGRGDRGRRPRSGRRRDAADGGRARRRSRRHDRRPSHERPSIAPGGAR